MKYFTILILLILSGCSIKEMNEDRTTFMEIGKIRMTEYFPNTERIRRVFYVNEILEHCEGESRLMACYEEKILGPVHTFDEKGRLIYFKNVKNNLNFGIEELYDSLGRVEIKKYWNIIDEFTSELAWVEEYSYNQKYMVNYRRTDIYTEFENSYEMSFDEFGILTKTILYKNDSVIKEIRVNE